MTNINPPPSSAPLPRISTATKLLMTLAVLALVAAGFATGRVTAPEGITVNARNTDRSSFFYDADANVTIGEFRDGYGTEIGWITQDTILVNDDKTFYFDYLSSNRVSAVQHGAYSIRIIRNEGGAITADLPESTNLFDIVRQHKADQSWTGIDVWPGTLYPQWNPLSELAHHNRPLLKGDMRLLMAITLKPASGHTIGDYFDKQAAPVALKDNGATGYLSTSDISLLPSSSAQAKEAVIRTDARVSPTSFYQDGPWGATVKTTRQSNGTLLICLTPSQEGQTNNYDSYRAGPVKDKSLQGTVVYRTRC